MKVAFVHDWLDSYRGGEKVLEQLIALFPEAPIYTMFYDPSRLPTSITKRVIHYPQSLKKFRRIRKALLPLLPAIIETFDFDDYDLIISSSSCVAKGVITKPHTAHISYVHSPMRYIWDQKKFYFGSWLKVPLLGLALEWGLSQLRIWDVTSARRVDQYIANSSFVQRRIKKYLGAESLVIHPSIDIDKFSIAPAKEDYYLVAGAFVPYKKFDLAIEACRNTREKLIVAGRGPLEQELRSLAGPNTEFIIGPTDNQMMDLMARAKALIFPGIEDFGIVPIEAMACGTPVIGFNRGGIEDYLEEGVNGIFFKQQITDSLENAMASFDAKAFDPETIRQSVAKFDHKQFIKSVEKLIVKVWENHR